MKIQNLKLKIQNYSPKFKVLLYVLLIYLTFNFAFLAFNLDKAEASALSLSLDPPITEIKAIPPATVTSPLNIQNKGDAQVTLQIQIKPFKAKEENGELAYSNETLEILKNIRILDANLPVENIIIGPKQQKNLNLNINIPQDISVSDYYFSVIFISTNSSPIESSSSVNQIGIATNVLLSIGPKEIPKAVLEEFSSDTFFGKGPVPFTIRIKNEGAHFIEPKGEITIKNMFGQSIGKLDLTEVNILSGSTRAIPNKNSSDLKHPIALWRESFLLGLYTATINISMSDKGPIFTKAIYFFAFPFQVLIVIAVITIIAVVVKSRLNLYMNKSRT